jgi:phosphoribosylamine--glycine ligase
MSEEIMARIIRPAVAGMKADGRPFKGVLFAGLMIGRDGPKLIEFNVRFGDPECQVVMPRLAVDLADVVHAAASGAAPEVRFTDDACVTVVLAAEGYPASPRTGDVISGLAEAGAVDGVTVFHAGTKAGERGEILTAGGRVLNVTATGNDLTEARERAYAAAARISWPGMQFRADIAELAAGRSGDGANAPDASPGPPR